MQNMAKRYPSISDAAVAFPNKPTEYLYSSTITCNWKELRMQLMTQWPDVTENDLQKTGPHRNRIARLISRKYGVAYHLIENYLSNFERTMPLTSSVYPPDYKGNRDAGEIH